MPWDLEESSAPSEKTLNKWRGTVGGRKRRSREENLEEGGKGHKAPSLCLKKGGKSLSAGSPSTQKVEPSQRWKTDKLKKRKKGSIEGRDIPRCSPPGRKGANGKRSANCIESPEKANQTGSGNIIELKNAVGQL